MLSTNSTSSIQRRRTQHRRQNSTPAAFEAPKVRPLPATNTRQTRQQRSGMSLDLRGLNLETNGLSQPEPIQGPIKVESSFQQEDSTVSITNPGQPQQQHTMQVAQTHSQPQPGPQESFMQSPVHQSFPSPPTPHRRLSVQSPIQPPLSPTKPPTERQLQELHEHIQSVYGNCGQVFINILPTPTATPQKPADLRSHEPLDTAPMPTNLSDMGDIKFEQPGKDFSFGFENPDSDMGYESSSYYTSDALSPSPMSSPQQRSVRTFLEDIEEHPSQQMAFSQPPPLMPASSMTNDFNLNSELTDPASRPSIFPDADIDASIEYTGISSEEVQRFISEQDPVSNLWTCLYPECDKTFGRRENIRSHVQTHLGDRQYRCNRCGKCFVRSHDLKRHATIHTGNKPYKCPCGAGFARQDALTRHRQRGMCVGGFPDAVRRQAKRGRPKKNRPDMEDRVKKASRTRRALASAASSVSAGSPPSDTQSMGASPSPIEDMELLDSNGFPKLMAGISSFSDPVDLPPNPFSFDTASSPFASDSAMHNDSFASSSSFTQDEASLNILQHLSGTTHTPPMSPANTRPNSSNDAKPAVQSMAQDTVSTPSRSSLQSNPFSTPPTSPAEPPRDELDELFNSLSDDNTCSQFDLEMKAMGDFTSFDSNGYELLDFTM